MRRVGTLFPVLVFPVIIASAAFALSGCSAAEPVADAAAAPAPPAHNAADIAFAGAMIPHCQEAVDLAAVAAEKSTDERVRTLATRIRDGLDPDIAELSSLLETWAQPAPEDPAFDAGGHGGGPSASELAAIRSAKGVELDRDFVDLMTRHHRAGIDLIGKQRNEGVSPRARAVADRLAVDSQAEIAELDAVSAP